MPGLKLALHTWTIDTTSLETAMDAAGAAGFDAVELRRSDFVQCFVRGQTRADVIGTIQRSPVPVGVLGTEYGWFFSTGDEQRRMFDVLRETCQIAREIGCDMIMSAPGQLTGTIAQAIEATKIAGDIVARHGLRLALEFNSQHPVVNRTDVLREIIAGAGNSHCGLLLDSYHLHRSQGIARGLSGVRKDELFVFQYSDVPVHPQAGVRRPVDRLPPGQGVLDWAELFSILAAIGYDGYLSYEAPNPALWARSPYEVAREGLESTRALLDCARPSAHPPFHAATVGRPRMSHITLAEAAAIVDSCLAKGRALTLAPLTVVVLDGGGHVVAAKREDDSGILRFEIAVAKAFGALGFGLGSRGLASRANKAPHFVGAVAAVAEGRMVPAPGGVLIRNADGKVAGAVGISGDTGDNDEICAVHGIEAAGLRADPGT